MQHDRFAGLVQHRAALASRGAAEGAVRATLETLGQRLEKSAADHLAAQLPPPMAIHLRHAAVYAKLTLEEFFGLVAEREGVDRGTAGRHARVVLGILSEVISPGALKKLQNELPHEFRFLLESDIEVRWEDFAGAVQ
jgi:uncharacterized protein (DUF2267 family)